MDDCVWRGVCRGRCRVPSCLAGLDVPGCAVGDAGVQLMRKLGRRRGMSMELLSTRPVTGRSPQTVRLGPARGYLFDTIGQINEEASEVEVGTSGYALGRSSRSILVFTIRRDPIRRDPIRRRKLCLDESISK